MPKPDNIRNLWNKTWFNPKRAKRKLFLNIDTKVDIWIFGILRFIGDTKCNFG